MTESWGEDTIDCEKIRLVDKDPENKPSSENEPSHKTGNIAKGIVCAFLWAFLQALSRICVQGLENRCV